MLSSWTFAKKGIKTFDEYVVEYNEYLGLGSGSFSFIKDTLYINTFSLQEYKKKVSNEEFSIQRFKRYEKNDILRYQLLLDLFSNSFSKEKYLENYGVDIISKFKWEFRILRWLGILKKDSYKTTPFGSYFFLTLMKEFYIGMDYVREISREKLKPTDSVFV
jgi:coproporphyrinogen III oxidase-like Fe-S oxidoreductase